MQTQKTTAERFVTRKISLKDKISHQFNTLKQIGRGQKISFFIIVILFIALSFVGYLYVNESKKNSSPTTSTQEAQQILGELRKIILIPENEFPTIANIDNVDTLKSENPEFYKDAQNNDKIFFFSQRVIIYRPSENIIINVAPIIVQPSGD